MISNNSSPESWFGRSTAIQPDGTLIVAGNIDSAGHIGLLLLRYDEQGFPDNSFGLNGVIKSFGIYPESRAARSVALQTDGKIVVAGFGVDNTGTSGYFVARNNSDGSADMSFNGTAYVITTFNGNQADANAVAIQQDGKIVVSGSTYSNSLWHLTFVRYNTDGTLDLSFGANGKAITALTCDQINEGYLSMLLCC